MERNKIEDNALAAPITEQEKIIIKAWQEKKEKSTSALEWCKIKEGKCAVDLRTKSGSREERRMLQDAALYAATGSADPSFANLLYANCLAGTGLLSFENAENDAYNTNAVVNALTGLQPQDAIEGMLITRLVSLHFQGMAYLRCAIAANQTSQGIDLNVNRSAKLMRLYNETLETLVRYRRKGEQRVVVQHVQVNDGRSIAPAVGL
ncbi:MAG: hypothetical protein WCN87_01715, partial [Chlamydiota bacterium]